MAVCYITGSKGFIGTYLRKHLEERGDTISGTADDIETTYDILPETEIVYHAGALVRPQESNLAGQRVPYFEANVISTCRLLEEVAWHAPKAKVVLFGSGGQDHMDSWYAYTKALGELIGDGYFKFDNVAVYRLRLFGVTGVGKTGDVINDFAKQAALDGKIQHGRLDYWRDISDVRDMVPAIVRTVEKEKPGKYWLGRGEATSIRKIAEWFGVPLEEDATRVRNEDETHVAPEKRVEGGRPIEETLTWVLDSYKRKL